MECIQDEGQRLAVEFMAKLVSRPVKATYDLATLGGKTQHGGEVVTASTDIQMEGHRIACVGDIVRYPGGIESRIISGCSTKGVLSRSWAALPTTATSSSAVCKAPRRSGSMPTTAYWDCCSRVTRNQRRAVHEHHRLDSRRR